MTAGSLQSGSKSQDREQFQVAPNMNATILPVLAEEERFTVTVLIPRTTN